MAKTENRDELILAHIARYRITTVEMLSRAFALSPDAASKALSRRAPRFVLSFPFVHPRVYYGLTTAGTRLAKVSPKLALSKPLGRQALARAYAVLAFCCAGEPQRHRLTEPELREDFPALFEDGFNCQAADYLVQEFDGRPVLSRIFVHHAGNPVKFTEKCADHIGRLRRYRVMRELMEDGNFALIALTTGRWKKGLEPALAAAFGRATPDRPRIAVHTYVVDELRDLYAS